MAQRYGGKYSPGAPQTDPTSPPTPPRHPFDAKRPARGVGRSNIFFIAALLPLIPALAGGPGTLFAGLGASALLLGSAYLTRQGQIAEDAFNARALARRPAIPRKIFGAVLAGAGLALAASLSQPGLYPALFALAGVALHLAAFGLDPLRDKGTAGLDDFQSDRVTRAVDEAERSLSQMKDAILRARDPQLAARVDRFAATAQALFRGVEADPGDLTAARKYLSVYLAGARDATVKFADFYASSRDASARAEYLALLDDLDSNFASRTQALLSNNRSDLDVEISVLRERLNREG